MHHPQRRNVTVSMAALKTNKQTKQNKNKKPVTYSKISAKLVNPRDKAGNAKNDNMANALSLYLSLSRWRDLAHRGLDLVLVCTVPLLCFDICQEHSSVRLARTVFQRWLAQKRWRIICHVRGNYFANRVVNLWNSLPDNVVTAPSVDSFKRRLDKHWAALPSMYDPECLA